MLAFGSRLLLAIAFLRNLGLMLKFSKERALPCHRRLPLFRWIAALTTRPIFES